MTTRSIWTGIENPARRRPGRPPRDRGAGHELTFPRADPAELDAFDPSSKRCTQNCGPHVDDPRPAVERKLLCDECELVPAAPHRR